MRGLIQKSDAVPRGNMNNCRRRGKNHCIFMNSWVFGPRGGTTCNVCHVCINLNKHDQGGDPRAGAEGGAVSICIPNASDLL